MAGKWQMNEGLTSDGKQHAYDDGRRSPPLIRGRNFSKVKSSTQKQFISLTRHSPVDTLFSYSSIFPACRSPLIASQQVQLANQDAPACLPTRKRRACRLFITDRLVSTFLPLNELEVHLPWVQSHRIIMRLT